MFVGAYLLFPLPSAQIAAKLGGIRVEQITQVIQPAKHLLKPGPYLYFLPRRRSYTRADQNK